MVNCNTPMNNLTYCGLNTLEKFTYTMKSKVAYGLPLWSILAIGVSFILIYVFFLNKMGFFDDKKDVKVAKSVGGEDGK